MARPYRVGLDYWPMDVDYFNDPKFQFLRAKCGFKGEWICIRLLATIYRNGYYTPWSEDDQLLFAKNLNEGIRLSQVCAVVNEAIKRELFSEVMFLENSILTSRGIQTRYIKACTDSRRKIVEIEPKYSLLTQKPELLPNQSELISTENTQREREREREKDKEIESESESEKISLPSLVFKKPFLEDLEWFNETSKLIELQSDKLQRSAAKFWDEKYPTGKNWTSLLDLRNHFMNWRPKQPKISEYLIPTFSPIE